MTIFVLPLMIENHLVSLKSWIYILIASVFEISWAVGLKYSDGFSNLYPSIFTVITMILSYVFLAMGVKELPVGTA